MSNSTLPRQHTNVQTGLWSIVRDNQLRSLIEDALASLHGAGVVSGGKVTKTTGYSAEVAAGTVFFQEGVYLTLAAAQAYTAAVASDEVFIYGQITRTPANPSLPAAADAFALTITHNLTGITPADYFPLSVWLTDGSGILTIRDPEGKYLKHTSDLWQGKTEIAAANGAVIASDEQFVASKLKASGPVRINGRLRITG